MAWYVVYSKPKQENLAVLNLNNQNFETFNPGLRSKKRRSAGLCVVEEPLFPRYLFVNLEEGRHDFSKIRSTRGCVDFVRFSGQPKPVDDAFVDSLRQSLGQDNFLDLTPNYTKKFAVGQKVQVLEGAFSGFISEISALKSEDRVLVLLDVLGSRRKVELPVSCLE